MLLEFDYLDLFLLLLKYLLCIAVQVANVVVSLIPLALFLGESMQMSGLDINDDSSHRHQHQVCYFSSVFFFFSKFNFY